MKVISRRLSRACDEPGQTIELKKVNNILLRELIIDKQLTFLVLKY